jgi:hypothetical protein
MKLKLYHIIILFGFVCFSSVTFAQDGTETMEPEIKSSFMPSGESQKFDTRDSVYLQQHSPAIQKASDTARSGSEASKDEDDDVLSFNFLYYIIQKFKMSDIVDP